MKKIFVSFLTVLTFWHFGLSAFASDFELESDMIDYDLELPVVLDTPQYYSASFTLGSITLGGLGVTVAPATIAGIALGAVTIGVGSYVVYKGINNIVQVGQGIYQDYLDNYKIDNVMNVSFDIHGNMVFESLKENISSFSSLFISNAFKEKYAHVEDGNLHVHKSSFDCYTLINDLGNVTVKVFTVGSTSSGSIPKIQATFYAPSGLHFQYNYRLSDGSTYTQYAPVIKLTYDNGINITGLKTSDTNFYRLSHSNQTMTMGNNIGLVTTGKNLEWTLNGKDNNGKLDNYEMNLSKLLSFLGISLANAQSLYDSREILNNPISRDYVIPKEYIGTLNPDLTFENGSWVNSEGEKVDPKDVAVPLPNVMNPDGSLSFDNALDSVLQGSSTTEPPVSLPDIDFSGIMEFLSSIVSWLTAFPGWLVSNLVNVITGAITSVGNVIGNIWSWCQDLPNVLSQLLNGIIEFLQSIGLTLADILTFVISLPLELVNALVDMFTFVFVPSDGFFASELSELGDIFVSKFPFFGQIGDIIKAFKFDLNAKLPEFKITLPNHIYGGGTYHVISFDSFVQYRVVILNFIRLFTWFPFIIRMYKKSVYMATGH